jgi:heme/copper-type cytochrome/quinol oxidase subunit 2
MAHRLLAHRSLAWLFCALLVTLTASASGPAQDPGQARVELVINAHKYEFTPGRLDVAAGDVVKVTLVTDDIPHSFTIDAYRISKRAAPGRPVTFEFRADQVGSFPFYCDLTIDDGCRQMRGVLTVAPRRP